MRVRQMLITMMVLVFSTVGAAAEAPKVTLTFAVQTLGDVHGNLEVALAQKYMESNPNVIIEPIRGQEIATFLAGGIIPDLIGTQTSDVTLLNMIEHKVLMSLDDLAKRYGTRKDFKLSDLHPAMVEMHRVDGEVHLLPYRAYPMLTYINTELFHNTGVSVPNNDWTWNEYQSKLQKITRDTNGDGKMDIWGGGTDPEVSTRLSSWIWQNGGDWFTPDTKQALIKSPQVIGAIDWLADMARREIHVPDSVTGTKWSKTLSLFAAGKLGVYGPQGIVTQFQSAPFEWDVIFPPQNVQRATFSGNRGYVIHKDAAHKEIAWDFAQYLASWEAQLYRWEQLQVLGTHRRLGSLPGMRNSERPVSYRSYLDIIPFARSLPQRTNVAAAMSMVVNAYLDVWRGGKSATVVTNEIFDAVNARLQQ